MKSLRQVFAVPALLGLLSLIGLLSALLADGLWDGLSWLTLGGVVAVAVWHAVFASPKRERGSAPSASPLNQKPAP